MKGPRKTSKQDFSSIVTLFCLTLGVIMMGVVVVPTINSIFGKVFATIVCILIVVILVGTILYQIKTKGEEGEKKK